MPGIEQLSAESDLKGAVDKFKSVRNLGRVVTELQLQIDRIQKGMDVLAPDALEAPEGMAFRFMATGPEDPMHVEAQRSEYHSETVWSRVWPPDYDRLGGPKIATPPSRFHFDGARIEYGHDRKVWVYNKEGALRILFEHGVMFYGIVMGQK